MSSSKFDGIKKVLAKGGIKFLNDDYKALACVICKNILIDAQVAPCTCRFCLKCITDYLETEQYCPGETDDCKSEILEIENVAVDHYYNRKVALLIVECPEELCSHECELRKMAEHLRMCELKNGSCPFYLLGCEDTRIPRDKMADHMVVHGEGHSKLMIDMINNLKNDVKASEEKRRVEREEWRDAVDQLRTEVGSRHDEHVRRTELAMQRREAAGEAANEMRLLRDENAALRVGFNQLESEIRAMRSELDKSRQVEEALRVDVAVAQLKLAGGSDEFAWRVRDVVGRKGTNSMSWSDYFYASGGQKMCLAFYPDGSGALKDAHVSVELCMSNYQCHQAGAFAGRAVLSVLDQRSGAIHKAWQQNCKIDKGSCSAAFDWPLADLTAGGAFKNDSIVVKCVLNYD